MTYTEKKSAILAYLTRHARFCSPTEIAREVLGYADGESGLASAACKKMVAEGLLWRSDKDTNSKTFGNVRAGWYRIKK